MLKLNHLKPLFFSSILALFYLGPGQPIRATSAISTDPIFLITEFEVSPSTAEFIEFTNNSNQELEITSLSLEYHSDTSTTYSNKTLSLVKALPLAMPAGSKLQLSSNTSLWVQDSIATFAPGLKDSAGWIKLNVEAGGFIYSDTAHWGVKDELDCTTSPAPASSQSLKRFVDSGSLYLMSAKAGENFYISSNPTPLDQTVEVVNNNEVQDYCNKPVIIDPVEPGPTTVTPNPTGTIQPAVALPTPEVNTQKTYLPIEISEVMADPVSPQTDTEDEYIEIYNPNQETLNLSGYQLQSGNSFSYKYVLDNIEIGPGQHLVFYRKDSGLTLANTSSSVRVLDPNGTVLDQTSYSEPEPAASWAKINGTWMYTSSNTPAAANIFLAPVAKIAKVSTKKAPTKTTKKAATKKTTTKKASAKKASSTAKTKKPKSTATPSSHTLKEDPITKLNSKYIYIAIAVLAAYNLWEYRVSIKRFLLRPIAKRKLRLSV